MPTDPYEITVGEFKSHLESYDDDDVLTFGGFDFTRLKRRGEKLVHVEFLQSVDRDKITDEITVMNHHLDEVVFRAPPMDQA